MFGVSGFQDSGTRIQQCGGVVFYPFRQARLVEFKDQVARV